MAGAAERGRARAVDRVKENETMAERKPGAPPEDSVKDRAAQEHDLAGGEPRPGLYPADAIEDREGENTPEAADPQVDWDARVQPGRRRDIEKGT
jgi:hypothetical protein